MPDDIDKGELLEAIYEHYDLPCPSARRKMLCPVHDESDPSCVVDPVKGYWHCYACNQGGDAIQLVMIKEGLRFKDALRFANEVLDRSGRSVRPSSSGFSRSGVSGSTRDRPEQRRYVPSWLR